MNEENYHPIRRSVCARLDDIDALVAAYQSAPLRCAQTSRGRLGAEVHAVTTPRLELRDVAFEGGITLTAADPFPRFGLAVGVTGEAEIMGRQLTNSNLGYITGDNGMIAHLQPGSRWCNISFDWDLIISVAETHGYTTPRGDRTCGVPAQVHQELWGMLARVARNEQYAECSDAELEDELALAALRLLDTRQRAGKALGGSHQRTVHRVIDFIVAEFSRPITITSLCRLCGVSERTLQYRFKQVTGLTVQQYLMIFRLQKARAMLMRGEYQQISDVASACGIHHAGRFAQYYRQLFGKSPKATLTEASRRQPGLCQCSATAAATGAP